MKFDRLAHLPDSLTLRDQVRAETDTLLLAFSCGKDSLAAWLFLRDAGFQIVPFFMYLVPELESDEAPLRYYESFFDCHILRIPHWQLFYANLIDYVYQPPQNVAKILALHFPVMDIGDYAATIAEYMIGWGKPYYNALGFRASESLYRRGFIVLRGVLASTTSHHRFYYPLWDWTQKQTLDYIRSKNVKLHPVYRFGNRIRTSLEWRDVRPIFEKYPGDYEKICKYFPLYPAEKLRAEMGLKYGKETR